MDTNGLEHGTGQDEATLGAEDKRSHPHWDHFLRLMLLGPKSWPPEVRPLREFLRASDHFMPLPHFMASPGDCFTLPLASTVSRVTLESPASDVMTDLRQVGAITIDPTVPVDNANATMIAQGVRALFVMGEGRRLQGIVTATDVLGERPVMVAQARGAHHSDVLVRDIMTPSDRLEILEMRHVQHACVGDIVATLKRAGRQHAIAVETSSPSKPAEAWVRGIFSVTQIARQLGVRHQTAHDLAHTFAEIEAIIGP